jgi:hypothetical protein
MNSRQNHLEKQELLKKNKLAAGLVSERFPGVSEIVFSMTYYQKTSQAVLMQRTLNFISTDFAYFRMECMRDECTNGGFDLTSVVVALVKSKKKSVKGKISCTGKNETLAPGHASIAYEITVQNNPAKKKK